MSPPNVTDADAIARLWREGHTDAEIARVLGITAKAVKGRRHRLGLLGDPVEPVDRDQLRELHAAGANAKQIADALGCTHRTAQELLFREGLSTRAGRRRLDEG